MAFHAAWYLPPADMTGSVPPPSSVSPSYRDLTVGDLLTHLACALPAQPALLYEDGPRYTFADLEHEARLIARGLIAHGAVKMTGETVTPYITLPQLTRVITPAASRTLARGPRVSTCFCEID